MYFLIKLFTITVRSFNKWLVSLVHVAEYCNTILLVLISFNCFQKI